MIRFLLLYTLYVKSDNPNINFEEQNRYAEGLVHGDGRVYVRDFLPDGQLYFSMLDLRNSMRDNEEIKQYQILELDKENT